MNTLKDEGLHPFEELKKVILEKKLMQCRRNRVWQKLSQWWEKYLTWIEIEELKGHEDPYLEMPGNG